MRLNVLRSWVSLVVLLVSVCVSASVVKAQTATADILGTVTDNTGAIVPGAKVIVTNLGTNATQSINTSGSGDYTFTLLPPGSYSITVEAAGFKKSVTPTVTVSAGDRARVDAQMEVGAVTQTVEVQATVAPVLQTDSSTVAAVVTNQSVEDLPVNGRNFIRLVQLAPGANEGPQSSLSGGNRPDDRRQTSTVSANGQNDSTNNFLLDGMDNNERAIMTIIVKPQIDAIQEVKVDTNLYSADLGRVGGAVVEMITKSGTNSLHGTAYEFVRNDMFDAKNFFNVPIAGNPFAGVKPEFRQNQYGGSIGGPIRKGKTFFFADYEGLRIIQGITQAASVPSPCELGLAACNGLTQLGNFSASSLKIYQPGTSTQYSCGAILNCIPLSAMNPVSMNYAALFQGVGSAIQACTTEQCNYVSSPNRTQYAHTADIRIDQHFSDKDTIFGRYSINNTDSAFPGGLPAVKVAGIIVYPSANTSASAFPGSNYSRQQNLTLGWDHVISPNLVLDLHAAASRYVSQSTSLNQGTNVNTAFGGPGNSELPGGGGYADTGLIYASFAGNESYSQLGDAFALPTDYWDTNFQYTGALTWVKGAHTFKFGASVLRRNWTILQALTKGTFGFNNLQTSCVNPAPPTPPVCPTGVSFGSPFASMLVGAANSQSRNLSLVAPEDKDWEIGEYAQDDWRATHWLTLNLGIRYDIFTPSVEKHLRMANFDPTNAGMLSSGSVVIAGQNNVSNTAGVLTVYNQFQPRLGFAATLRHGFVLRGGLGTAYFVGNSASPAALKNPPFASVLSNSSPPPAGIPFGLGNDGKNCVGSCFPYPTLLPITGCLTCTPQPYGATQTSIADGEAVGYRNAKIIMYNLTLEKAFGSNDISVGWVGEPGRNLNRPVSNVNIPAPPGLYSGTNPYCGLQVGGTGPGAAIGANNAPVGSSLPTSTTINKASLSYPPANLALPNSSPGQCTAFYNALPFTSSIQLLESNGASSYNGMNVIFQRRLQNGLTVLANYTYMQSFADVSGPGGAFGTQLPNNPRYDWGLSPYDVRHRIAVSVNYQIPFGKSAHGFEAAAIKGWQVNGIYSFASGVPFTVTEPSNFMGISGVSGRPNMVSNAYANHAFVYVNGQPTIPWFNTSDFVEQPFGFPGNEHMDQLFSPAAKKVDFSVFKDFQLKESLSLQFRTEVFNIFNIVSFAAPGGAIPGFTSAGVPTTNGTYGTITSSNGTNTFYTPRDIQFALKLIF